MASHAQRLPFDRSIFRRSTRTPISFLVVSPPSVISRERHDSRSFFRSAGAVVQSASSLRGGGGGCQRYKYHDMPRLFCQMATCMAGSSSCAHARWKKSSSSRRRRC